MVLRCLACAALCVEAGSKGEGKVLWDAEPRTPKRRKAEGGVKCYKCKNFGHYAFECPEKRKETDKKK